MTAVPTRSPVAFVALSMASFVASLAFDAVAYDNVTHHGFVMLVLGWMGPLALQFGWYANPLLWTAWILMLLGHRTGVGLAARILLSVATGLAATSIPTLALGQMMGPNEGTMAGAFIAFGTALYLWLASIVVATVGAWLARGPGAATP